MRHATGTSPSAGGRRRARRRAQHLSRRSAGCACCTDCPKCRDDHPPQAAPADSRRQPSDRDGLLDQLSWGGNLRRTDLILTRSSRRRAQQKATRGTLSADPQGCASRAGDAGQKTTRRDLLSDSAAGPAQRDPMDAARQAWSVPAYPGRNGPCPAVDLGVEHLVLEVDGGLRLEVHARPGGSDDLIVPVGPGAAVTCSVPGSAPAGNAIRRPDPSGACVLDEMALTTLGGLLRSSTSMSYLILVREPIPALAETRRSPARPASKAAPRKPAGTGPRTGGRASHVGHAGSPGSRSRPPTGRRPAAGAARGHAFAAAAGCRRSGRAGGCRRCARPRPATAPGGPRASPRRPVRRSRGCRR